MDPVLPGAFADHDAAGSSGSYMRQGTNADDTTSSIDIEAPARGPETEHHVDGEAAEDVVSFLLCFVSRVLSFVIF